MTGREAFEAWHGAIGVFARYASTGAYANAVIESQWLAWQASRKQALEEALAAVLMTPSQFGENERCAVAIRSLNSTH